MELNKVDVSKIPLEDAIVVGKPDAKHKVIVFDDPECPYCKQLQAEMGKVVAKRGDVAFFIKMFPLTIHPGAYEKAKAIVCEKSLQLLEDSLSGKPLPPAKCETRQVDENMALAKRLGISGTPTLIFPDGVVSPGFRSADGIVELLDRKP
jgi:thiol:disulfide interchange protein DsbC